MSFFQLFDRDDIIRRIWERVEPMSIDLTRLNQAVQDAKAEVRLLRQQLADAKGAPVQTDPADQAAVDAAAADLESVKADGAAPTLTGGDTFPGATPAPSPASAG